MGFDEFLNRHRDPKDIEKEVLEKKLANTDPFKGDRFLEQPIVDQAHLQS